MGHVKMFKSFLVLSFFLISGESVAAAGGSASKSAAPSSNAVKSEQAPAPAAPAVEVVESVDDHGQQSKKEDDAGFKSNDKLFADIVVSGRVLRVRDEVAVDRADKVVNKGLGVRIENPQFDFSGNPSLRKKFEFFHKSIGIWISTNLKNEVLFDDCSNIAQQGRKSESKFKITFKNYPVHALYWKDQVFLLNHLKQYFSQDLKKGKLKSKDVEDLAKKAHLLGYIPANLEQVSVSCELVP